jgi:hypothetical protein
MSVIRPAEQRSPLQTEHRQYRRVYLASFVFFIVVAMAMRLVPGHAQLARAADGARKSILAEARETAHAAIGFAFMH